MTTTGHMWRSVGSDWWPLVAIETVVNGIVAIGHRCPPLIPIGNTDGRS